MCGSQRLMSRFSSIMLYLSFMQNVLSNLKLTGSARLIDQQTSRISLLYLPNAETQIVLLAQSILHE